MRIEHLQEPELEFGTGRHIDIRFGIMTHGPLDVTSDLAPKTINVGIIGTPETIEGVTTWLDRCRKEIPPKPSNQPHLFPRFPGCTRDHSLHTNLVLDPQLHCPIKPDTIKQIIATQDHDRIVQDSVTLFLQELTTLRDKPTHVVVCAIPLNLLKALESDEAMDEDNEEGEDGTKPSALARPLDFHHLLKARAFPYGMPLQLVLPWTYDETKRPPRRMRPGILRTLQDEATRAWNFHVALYYKAKGIPWRIVRNPGDFLPCYVGVSFYETLDRTSLHTSVAQVFNDRGDGMIVRGGAATISKEDRQPHLDEQGAHDRLNNALRSFAQEHHHQPARVVLHKTSAYSSQEADGFRAAAQERDVHSLELLNQGSTTIRLFRLGQYPVLRGTILHLASDHCVVYTRGSVDFFQTYPGMYVPQPLSVRLFQVEQTPRFHASEILALSKMNWNQTQFDGRDPITIRAARQVGKILKHVPEGQPIQAHYRYYM